MSRKFDSEICINAMDEWIFHGNAIVHENILQYFRSHLKEDQDGIYILNQFGELEEHGYVEILGYPLHITHISEEDGLLYFSSDSGVSLKINEIDLLLNNNQNLILKRKEDHRIFQRLSNHAAGQIAEWIEETNNGYSLVHQKASTPILKIENTCTKIPTNYLKSPN